MKKLVPITAVMGWAFYVLSLFLPAVYEPGVGRVFSGMEALFLSGLLLLMTIQHSIDTLLAQGPTVFLVSVAMCLSNLVMWATPRPLLSKRRVSGRIFPALMLVLSVLNSIGPWALSEPGDLYVGYYMWTGSFWLVTAALYLMRVVSAPRNRGGASREAV